MFGKRTTKKAVKKTVAKKEAKPQPKKKVEKPAKAVPKKPLEVKKSFVAHTITIEPTITCTPDCVTIVYDDGRKREFGLTSHGSKVWISERNG